MKLKKDYIKKNKCEITNILFVCIIIILLLGGLLNTILNPSDINYYENRASYQMPKLEFNAIVNGSFQDNVELSFSDQIPFATVMKQGYNFAHNILSLSVANVVFSNNCENRYINLGNGTVSYGCDKDLVYYPNSLDNEKKIFDERIDDTNKLLLSTDKDVTIYYVEKDNDIDFSTGKKSGLYDYLKDHINTDKIYKFGINDFTEYKNYFYKTDHHWNYKGSYNAYVELVELLTDDEPMDYKDELCITNNFSGSKATYSGTKFFYKENFCAYIFDYPDYDIYVNGKEGNYGNEEYYYNNFSSDVSYGNFYGFDDGEVIFDNHLLNKPNILILGDSYDNAILKLLASHFNKTYSIDLRNYERENGNKFNYNDYIENNNIDKVLIVGNVHYFGMNEFNLEV